MMLIRLSITILVLATFKASVEGYGLPIFYSIDKEWKHSADDPLGYNNDHQSQSLGTWNHFNKKAHKLFPSVVSQFKCLSLLNDTIRHIYAKKKEKKNKNMVSNYKSAINCQFINLKLT